MQPTALIRISLFAQGFDGLGLVDSLNITSLTLGVEASPLEALHNIVELPLYNNPSRSKLICFLTFHISIPEKHLYNSPVRPVLFVSNHP